jgi:tRNA(Arg) A34 adenosine deaminase TadA
MRFPPIDLKLPDWAEAILPEPDRIFDDVKERMRLVIKLAEQNIEHKTGGPFAAAVFDKNTSKLIAPGVNLVVGSDCSAAHAEIVAISIAQKILNTYDLGAEGLPTCELVTSTEPCAMCLGAIPWSGVRSLVCGARDEDARELGFDEGAKPADWIEALRSRGVTVQRDVLGDEAKAVLEKYLKSGGTIYNAGQGPS